MEFYGEDDYARRSPGLDPVFPTLAYSTAPAFSPLWLPQDIASCPLAPVSIEHQSDGLEARRRLYAEHSQPPNTDVRFDDTLLLHHLAPNDPSMTLALGTKSNAELDSSDDESIDWPYASRFESIPFRFRPILNKPNAGREKRTRLGLPITIDPLGVAAATVLACADTGADANIMSEELAKILGYTGYETQSGRKQFRLANGKIVDSIGQVNSTCAFGTEATTLVQMSCIFHVLAKAIAPIIMGMQFLEETETLTKHRKRLVRVPRPAIQALSVCSIDRPRQVLRCNLDRTPITATADTGSEIDLISPRFAAELGISVQSGKEVIQLADGTFAVTCGYILTVLSTDSPAPSSPSFPVISSTVVQFHLLKDLTHKILVGEETLEQLGVFTDNQHTLIPVSKDNDSIELNGIRSHGAADRLLPWLKNILRGQQSVSNITGSDQVSDDQRENYRREQERERIITLVGAAQQAAQDVEAARQRQYVTASDGTSLLMDPSSPLPSISRMLDDRWDSTRGFRCNHPGCNALPFQTQYLLNSHKNIHDQKRPFFCPIAGCPRSRGGKGFEKNSELIRHGLEHQSPGYICPFCPDREHKYPRPDNLSRHVRIYHADKAHDDPNLRDVLAQRPEGGSRGRRRRISSSHSENT